MRKIELLKYNEEQAIELENKVKKLLGWEYQRNIKIGHELTRKQFSEKTGIPYTRMANSMIEGKGTSMRMFLWMLLATQANITELDSVLSKFRKEEISPISERMMK